MVLQIQSRDIPEKPIASGSAEHALRSSVPFSNCNPLCGMLRHTDTKLFPKACCTLRSTSNTCRGEVLRICNTSEVIAKHRERLDEDPFLQSSNAAGSTKPPLPSLDLQQNAHTRTWVKQTTARLAHDRRDERGKCFAGGEDLGKQAMFSAGQDAWCCRQLEEQMKSLGRREKKGGGEGVNGVHRKSSSSSRRRRSRVSLAQNFVAHVRSPSWC